MRIKENFNEMNCPENAPTWLTIHLNEFGRKYIPLLSCIERIRIDCLELDILSFRVIFLCDSDVIHVSDLCLPISITEDRNEDDEEIIDMALLLRIETMMNEVYMR